MSGLVHRRLHVTGECAGMRLDSAAARLSEGEFSRSQITEHARTVHLNGAPAKLHARVTGGDTIDLALLIPAPFSAAQPEALAVPVVMEDGDLVVFNKPWGMPVHPSAGHPGGTLVNLLLHRYPDLPGDTTRPGIIHRLDMDTSGLIVCAKTAAALAAMTALFKARAVEKRYTALVRGTPPAQEGMIELPLGRDPRHRQRQAVVAGGRTAKTGYRLLRRFPAHALLALDLYTGRTHQLRVHLAHLRCPILGDPLYARRERGFDRLCLAATELSFTHPFTGDRIALAIPLPAHMEAALRALEGQAR